MDTVSAPPGLPGSPLPSPEYTAAVALLAQVIATHDALIARERSRCHHDPAVIAQWQAERAAAVRAVAELTSADPQRLRETVDHYRLLRAGTGTRRHP